MSFPQSSAAASTTPTRGAARGAAVDGSRARRAESALVSTAAVRKPAAAQVTMPETSVGMVAVGKVFESLDAAGAGRWLTTAF